jgi:hypothetical protein
LPGAASRVPFPSFSLPTRRSSGWKEPRRRIRLSSSDGCLHPRAGCDTRPHRGSSSHGGRAPAGCLARTRLRGHTMPRSLEATESAQAGLRGEPKALRRQQDAPAAATPPAHPHAQPVRATDSQGSADPSSNPHAKRRNRPTDGRNQPLGAGARRTSRAPEEMSRARPGRPRLRSETSRQRCLHRPVDSKAGCPAPRAAWSVLENGRREPPRQLSS